MQQHKRKIYIINNTRDSEKCQDLRRHLNKTERQRGKQEVKEQLHEPDYRWDNFGDSLDDLIDEFYSSHWKMNSTGGKFISTLMKLNILKGDGRSFPAVFLHPHKELLDHCATNSDGIIYTSRDT